ncbi:MAG TPA: redoxin domain-containing protein [Gemmatimonadaceae bacterium]|nr:redoxin domain-containing protein [Gemmatimonadaceae bacterium]
MFRLSLLAASAVLALSASTATAQTDTSAGTVLPIAPEVGAMAPDFSARFADAKGVNAASVKLADLRGKVVVLAFYPLDRSRGCTVELEKFRDEYTTIFGAGAGSDVVVLPISVDSLETHASWIAEDKFPFALVSDPAQVVAKLYGSTMADRPYNARTVFVIDGTGKITYRNLKFGALNEQAYTDLAAAVAKATGM